MTDAPLPPDVPSHTDTMKFAEKIEALGPGARPGRWARHDAAPVAVLCQQRRASIASGRSLTSETTGALHSTSLRSKAPGMRRFDNTSPPSS